MQSGLDAPMRTSDFQYSNGGSLLPGETGDAILNIVAGFVDFASPDPKELAFQAVDLTYSRPIQILIEHFTGLNTAYLDAAMTITYLPGGLKVSFGLSKTGLGLVWGESLLNILAKPLLIVFYRP